MTAICNDRDVPASSSNTRGSPQMEYEAASYALGHQDFTLTLNFVGAVPSEVISVRRNMDVTLRYIRPTSQQRHLWIDVLCINQYDIKEKDASEVDGCGLPIRKAITIWTGPPTDALDGRFELFKTLVNYAHADCENSAERAAPWVQLQKFLKRRWLLRRWTIQEVLLAKHATMC
jgi:hypothetical protein